MHNDKRQRWLWLISRHFGSISTTGYYRTRTSLCTVFLISNRFRAPASAEQTFILCMPQRQRSATNGTCSAWEGGVHRGRRSLRGGIVDHTGKFAAVVNVIVINHVLCLIATARHGPSIGSFEKPVALVVAFDAKTAFMHQPVVRVFES